MMELYQFPLSHYCEKVRWALDYKGIPYHAVNLLPGFHLKMVKSISQQTSVPVLTHETKVVNGSGRIVSYLDDHNFPPRLTPENSEKKREALEWERLADNNIGPHVRRICYFILLNHPSSVIRMLTYNQPWYKAFFLRLIFPRLKAKMQKYMAINLEETEKSRLILIEQLEKLREALKEQSFLVDNTFTRADLAVAALLAPLAMPYNYDIPWPNKNVSEELQHYIHGYEDIMEWVREIYDQHRP
ncbi:glutathione S-transferase family protein [Marinibactrum halimedae]|uniref:Glutathione S-transferase n=1 Tax=Marinibactrum halimedae TaxID=1444977 RepID=A0AA37WLF9_9GAMM|nr:glutathione S-transferase family protein [Marinibactrum halimedae]MCD9459575.1 glutathione S-transferase family protein [Marinibactrum halimedae]GLS25608.1 glutathione S-transferase [Marinibactrum halimedae]